MVVVLLASLSQSPVEQRLARHFGVSAAEGASIRQAIEESGRIPTALSNTLFLGGDTEAARTWQPVSGPAASTEPWAGDEHNYALGSTLDALCQCPGAVDGPLSPSVFAEREFEGKPVPFGRSPLDTAYRVEHWGRAAESRLRGIEVTRQLQEFGRLRARMTERRLMAEFYAAKIRAAVEVKRWVFKNLKGGVDDATLEIRATAYLRRSLKIYRDWALQSESLLEPLPTYEQELEHLAVYFEASRPRGKHLKERLGARVLVGVPDRLSVRGAIGTKIPMTFDLPDDLDSMRKVSFVFNGYDLDGRDGEEGSIHLLGKEIKLRTTGNDKTVLFEFDLDLKSLKPGRFQVVFGLVGLPEGTAGYDVHDARLYLIEK